MGLTVIPFATSVTATIISIPDDYPTIQQGIDASSDGDTVVVQPGTYVENINFNGRNIVLGSLFLISGDTSYISSTIIDGNQSGRVIIFENGEDSTGVITGFTIRNGSGGIYCGNNSSPTITNNIISGNSFDGGGGGLWLQNSNPTISNNIISGNTAGSNGSGGGIGCRNSNPTISKNIISGNTVTNYNGAGGGIYLDNSHPAIINNTITGNTSNGDAGGIACYGGSIPLITNTICWGNTAYPGYTDEVSGSPIINYSDIRGGREGEGNIDADPLFVDAANDDFHLQNVSPCIDSGDPSSPYDPDSTIADIGAFYYHHSLDIDDVELLPVVYQLFRNYPNPFNGRTTISYALREALHITIEIYDLLGRKIETILDTDKQAGYQSIIWNAKDQASGMYFYRIQAGEFTETMKMLLLK